MLEDGNRKVKVGGRGFEVERLYLFKRNRKEDLGNEKT